MIANTPLDNWLTKQALYANLSAPSYAHAIDLDTRGVVMARTTADMNERRAAVGRAASAPLQTHVTARVHLTRPQKGS